MTPKLQRLHDALRNSLGGRIVSLKEALGELTAGLEDLHPGDAGLAGGDRRLDANPALTLEMRPGHATHA